LNISYTIQVKDRI